MSFAAASRKAAGIVKDYVLDLYFPVHHVPWRGRIRCMPVLYLVEYLVYRVDAVAEEARDVDLTRDDAAQVLHGYRDKFEALLRRLDAYNGSTARQIDMGVQYVRLENKVTATQTASHADTMRLAELRPSDVRLLHGMILALLGMPPDWALLDLLWPVEVLADIGNDLKHYRADVATGRFNTYAAFARLYGHEAPERLRAEITRYEQLFRARLAGFPQYRQAELAALCERRYRRQTQVIPGLLR